MSKEYDHWVRFASAIRDKVDIVESGEAEECDILVCRLKTDPLILSDNLVGTCSKCFRMIQFRPHVPKMPAKMCDECILPIIAKDKDLRMSITPKTARDIAVYLAKKRQH